MPPKKPKYVKKDPISHIIDRPDMYIGSIRSRQTDEFVVVDDQYRIEKRSINISPAIIRMFIEPLSNVIDNVARSKENKNPTTKICIDIDENGTVSFWNDGDVVPIETHDEEKCYNHTLIFGQLLTGSNYDDDDDREDISGRNGLGCKCVNIFSTHFTVEGVDPSNKKKFTQTWQSNMREASLPIVEESRLKKGYTKITYILDFARFGLENYTAEILSLYRRFIADAAMITKVPIFFNGEEVPIRTLVDYAQLYANEERQTLYIKTADCEVVLTPSHEFQAISFANGVFTPLGGTHVDAWAEAIFRPLVDKFNKPKKPQINIGDVKKFFRLFVIATVKKPEFDSQSKFKLESPAIVADVKKKHITTIFGWPVMERVEDIIRAKELVVLKKLERKTRGYQRVEGLDPANNEGGTKGYMCTLILVEGLSAKTYAINGVQKGAFGKQGRDWFGIYALRGKCLNCRNAKPVTIAKNNVVSDIIQALGLKHGVDYKLDENFKKLRYGRVLAVADADVDGIHICGLLQNMFHCLFPSLLERETSFFTSMQTPIVKVLPDLWFYDEDEYYKYVRENSGKKINKKYFKGLGSSNKKDVMDTFAKKLIEYKVDETCHDEMTKVFHNKYADMRKKWLEEYDPTLKVLSWDSNKPEVKVITHSDFINTELIKFSIDDCRRSIPNLIDGLKEGHRKVLYTCFKTKLKYKGKVIKVAQLSGTISRLTNYHHGENNLQQTMAGMANSYVGSNNIPLLYRDGQFGSRMAGGKDAAAGRYIWTKLDEITRLIFRQEDDALLDYIENDGDKIEPTFYVPIIPMVLVNGCLAGIGTGWSSTIPCFNPKELIDSIRVWLDRSGEVFVKDEETGTLISLLPDIIPWYRGHTGAMVKETSDKFISWGKVEKDSKNKVHVTELPVGLWTNDFTEILEKMKEEKEIIDYKNYSTPDKISYVITESPDGIACDENNLKLCKTFRTTNMVLFTEKGIKKFENTDEIIDDYCQVRYSYYVRRKAKQLSDLEYQIKFLGNKKRFLEEVRDGVIKLFETDKAKKRVSRKTNDIVKELEERRYDKDIKDEEIKKDEDELENNDSQDEDDSENVKKLKRGHGYEYLLRLQISSITAEKIIKLANDIDSKIKERDELSATEERDIWLRELDELCDAYEKYIKNLENETSDSKKKKGKNTEEE